MLLLYIYIYILLYTFMTLIYFYGFVHSNSLQLRLMHNFGSLKHNVGLAGATYREDVWPNHNTKSCVALLQSDLAVGKQACTRCNSQNTITDTCWAALLRTNPTKNKVLQFHTAISAAIGQLDFQALETQGWNIASPTKLLIA